MTSDSVNTTGSAASTHDVIARFNQAFQSHQPALLEALVGPECVLENTGPAPDGTRHEGREECLAVWRAIASDPTGSFELEEVSVLGERAIVRWRYRWGARNADGVRGVNLMRVRKGLIVEGLGYVKSN